MAQLSLVSEAIAWVSKAIAWISEAISWISVQITWIRVGLYLFVGSKMGLLDKMGRICDEKKAFGMDVPWSYSGAREPVLVFISAKGQWGS